MHNTYIGLGSNLNKPADQLKLAIEALKSLAESKLEKVSSFYLNPPLGPNDQPDFVNAVVYLKTDLRPLDLLNKLKKIETQQGRKKTRRWGERIIDLDLLLYDHVSLSTPTLILPHPEITNRNFVVYPLLEVNPDLILPDGKRLDIFKQHLLADQLKIIKL